MQISDIGKARENVGNLQHAVGGRVEIEYLRGRIDGAEKHFGILDRCIDNDDTPGVVSACEESL